MHISSGERKPHHIFWGTIAMASQSASPQLTSATQGEEQSKQQVRPVFNETEKIQSAGETLPGWTIMRPLRMRGLKGKGTTASNSYPSTNPNGIKSFDSKVSNDLKAIVTNDTGDGPDGIGEIEPLHEVRSDEELLGPEDTQPTSQRVTTERGLENSGGHPLEGTSGEHIYKVYKRRWFGLIQLVLLNIIVSWDVSNFAHFQSVSIIG